MSIISVLNLLFIVS